MNQHGLTITAVVCAALTLSVVGNWLRRRQNRKLQELRQRAESIDQSVSGQVALDRFKATIVPRVGPTGMAKLGWGILAAFPAWMAIPIATDAPAGVAMAFFFTFGIGQFVFSMAFYFWNKRGDMVIGVTSGGLIVDRREGDIYSFADARLGYWVPTKYQRKTVGAITLGTALHLRCGPYSLVLGGRDHRLTAGARLEEPPTERLDAWMWAADFDQLLVTIGSRSRFDVRAPAPGEPIRCLLATNPWLLSRRQRRREAQPVLALDVGGDQIRAVDPNGNVPIASAPLAQVTATPADHVVRMKWSWKVVMVKPVLVLDFPGMEPLTIGCHDGVDPFGMWMWGTRQFVNRFSWSGNVPGKREPDFVVSGADWRTLVESFGLAQDLDDRVALARAWARR